MPLTKYAVMKFISNKIHAVTECNVTDLYAEFPSAKEWITGFARMSMYGNHHGLIPSEEAQPLLFLIMRRIETLFSEYALAREELQRFISGNVEWSVYYRALYHFEASLGQLYQALQFTQEIKNKTAFKTDDSSLLERLNRIHNTSKHQAAHEDQPVWLTNEGIEGEYLGKDSKTKRVKIKFEEIEEIMRECGRFAMANYRPEMTLTLQSIVLDNA